MVDDELLDPVAGHVPKPAIDLVTPNATLVNNILGLCNLPPIEQAFSERLVDGAYVRGPVRLQLGQLVEVRGPFDFKDFLWV